MPRQDKWGLMRRSALLTWVKMLWVRHKARQLSERQRQSAANEPETWMGSFEPGPVPPELMATVLEPLFAMQQLCRKHGIPMALASFGSSVGYRRLVEEWTQRTGCRSLELLTLFPDARSWDEMVERFSLSWDSHPNAEAHERWAQALLEMFAKHGLLPAK